MGNRAATASRRNRRAEEIDGAGESAAPRSRPAERQLPLDKLVEAGGRIARVAHELNAPVSLISGSLDTLDQYLEALVRYIRATEQHLPHNQELTQLFAKSGIRYLLENAPALLRICRGGAQRLNHVVQQLRGYVQTGVASCPVEQVDLTSSLDEAIAVAAHGRALLPTVDRNLRGSPPIAGVAELLSQAFVNVFSNAFDAVAATPDPHVWVESGSQERPSVPGGPRWVEVRIRDNGPGIPELDRQHIFEPFFTTKSRGAGLGLGLVITREILESQGGSIELSEPAGVGAEFVIRLPAGAMR